MNETVEMHRCNYTVSLKGTSRPPLAIKHVRVVVILIVYVLRVLPSPPCV